MEKRERMMPRCVCALSALLFLLLTTSPVRAEKNLRRPLGTTRYAAMVSQLTTLLDYDKDHGRRMTLTSLGKSVQGRDLWMVTLHEAQPEENIPLQPKRILYLCRQHGHEPASTEGALAFVNALVKADDDTPLAKSLAQVTVYVVPMANPDGSEAFLRHNAHDIDINRDWIRRTQPETRALYAAIQRLHPDLMTDQHELYPSDPRPDFTETVGPGSGAQAGLTAACDDAQNVVQGAMQAEGFFTVSHLITDTHPARLAHRFGSVLAGVPTILFETNRLTGSGRGVAARAAAHEQFMMTILRDQSGERDQLLTEAAAWQAAHVRETQMLASRHKLPARSPRPPTLPVPPPALEKGTE